jgi:ectoine hydroxylase-related dioxygenase (phytanoyl-CoA dioxygenase family)
MSALKTELPKLGDPYRLNRTQIDRFRSKGHIVLRDVLEQEEAAAWLQPIGAGVEKHRAELPPMEQRTTYQKAFIQVTNMWEVDEVVRRFVFAKRFARIAAELMGVDAVRLYHDQALFKEGGGGHTPWHQDQYYWPIDSPNTITMWMPLVDCPIEMGPMTFASSQHHRGSRAELAISDNSAAYFSRLAREEEWTLETQELYAGDATFHYGWTPHKAPGNSTNRARPVMTIIYHDASARVSQPTNSDQSRDQERFLPGLMPGDPAASELNPILWQRGD